MSNIRFTWDLAKATQNRRKHGVSFEEAQSVFYDDYAQLAPDPDHSKEEDRFILLGRSSQMRLLIVCHCYRESDSVIRIISARKATKKEQRAYPG
ncbi:BrnT family toxin [bacterium]|nr:BrnT family toxin [bacterium]